MNLVYFMYDINLIFNTLPDRLYILRIYNTIIKQVYRYKYAIVCQLLSGNFLLFPVVKNFENRLRFDEVTAIRLVAPFWNTV